MSNKSHYEKLQEKSPESGSTWDTDSLSKNSHFRNWCRERSGQTIKVINVGCGIGYFSKSLAEHILSRYNITCESYGTDLLPNENNVFSQIPGGLEFTQHDINTGPFAYEDASFDLVICNHVIEHVFETEHLVKELCRITRNNGTCIISTPNLASWINRILLLLGIQPFSTEVGTESMEYGWPVFREKLEKWNPPGHIRCFTANALKDMVCKYGFLLKGTWKQEKKLLYRNIALVLAKK